MWAARNDAGNLINQILCLLTSSNDAATIISKAVYWASASDRGHIVTKLMVDYKDKIRDHPNTIEAVQVAAFNGYEEIVCTLLSQVRDDSKKPKNESCKGLYWAVTWESDHARDVVRHLLMHGASPFSIADGNQTVLEWAREYQNSPFGLLRGFDMLELLESPIRVPPRPKGPRKPTATMELEEEMSKRLCIISDFHRQGNEFYTLQRRSDCYGVIYGNGPEEKMKESWSAWGPKDSWRMPDFRWIHLPLNDVSYA